MDAPANITQYLVSIINGSSFFGRILPGLLADHIGGLNCWFLSAFASGLVIVAGWTTVTSSGGLVAIAVLYGFVSADIGQAVSQFQNNHRFREDLFRSVRRQLQEYLDQRIWEAA